MITANNDKGVRVRAREVEKTSPKGEKHKYYCPHPDCKTQMILKKGSIKTHHFAHYPHSECIFTGESEAHLKMKEIVCEELEKMRSQSEYQSLQLKIRPEEDFYNSGELERRVDVMLYADGIYPTVFELQHSSISSIKFLDRLKYDWNHGWQVVWIFDYNTYFKDGIHDDYGTFSIPKIFLEIIQFKRHPLYGITLPGIKRLEKFIPLYLLDINNKTFYRLLISIYWYGRRKRIKISLRSSFFKLTKTTLEEIIKEIENPEEHDFQSMTEFNAKDFLEDHRSRSRGFRGFEIRCRAYCEGNLRKDYLSSYLEREFDLSNDNANAVIDEVIFQYREVKELFKKKKKKKCD